MSVEKLKTQISCPVPAIYDDSLTPYEVVNKSKVTLNSVIDQVNTAAADLADEVIRATGAEGDISDDIDAEVLRAKGAEDDLADDIEAEEIRATAAEGAINTKLDNFEGHYLTDYTINSGDTDWVIRSAILKHTTNVIYITLKLTVTSASPAILEVVFPDTYLSGVIPQIPAVLSTDVMQSYAAAAIVNQSAKTVTVDVLPINATQDDNVTVSGFVPTAFDF